MFCTKILSLKTPSRNNSKNRYLIYSGTNDLDLHFNISYYHLPKERIILWKQNIKFNHMAQWNLFDVILKFPAVLEFPADDL